MFPRHPYSSSAVAGESGRIAAPDSPSKIKLRSNSSNPTPEPSALGNRSGQLNNSGLSNDKDKESVAGSAPVSPVKGAQPGAANGAAATAAATTDAAGEELKHRRMDHVLL